MKLPGKIAVMGGGSWATAIAKIVLSKTETINWYMRRDDRIADFKRLGHNPAYLTSVKFDVKRIHFSSNINDIVKESDTLIFVTPSPYLKSHLKKLKTKIKDKFIISAIKGIVPDENLIVSEYFTEEYNVPPENIAVIAGPCHAEEVALERLSYLTIACPDTNKAQAMAERFASSYIKTSVSNDVAGIEYGSVLKNVYVWRQLPGCADVQCRAGDEPFSHHRPSAGPQRVRLGLLGRPAGDGLFQLQPQPHVRHHDRQGLFGEERADRDGDDWKCIKEINKHYHVNMPILDAVYNILYERISPSIEIKLLTDSFR